VRPVRRYSNDTRRTKSLPELYGNSVGEFEKLSNSLPLPITTGLKRRRRSIVSFRSRRHNPVITERLQTKRTGNQNHSRPRRGPERGLSSIVSVARKCQHSIGEGPVRIYSARARTLTRRKKGTVTLEITYDQRTSVTFTRNWFHVVVILFSPIKLV